RRDTPRQEPTLGKLQRQLRLLVPHVEELARPHIAHPCRPSVDEHGVSDAEPTTAHAAAAALPRELLITPADHNAALFRALNAISNALNTARGWLAPKIQNSPRIRRMPGYQTIQLCPGRVRNSHEHAGEAHYAVL